MAAKKRQGKEIVVIVYLADMPRVMEESADVVIIRKSKLMRQSELKAQYLALRNQCFPTRWDKKQFKKKDKRRGWIVYMQRDGRIVSSAEFYDDGDLKWGPLENVMTLEGWRGKGFAKLVMMAILRHVRNLGYEIAILTTLPQDVKLYEDQLGGQAVWPQGSD